MAYAFVYPEGHRGKKDVQKSDNFSRQRLMQARAVLRHSHKLAEAVLELAKHGGDRRSEQAKNQVASGNLKKKGTNKADYILARLKRDRPDLVEFCGMFGAWLGDDAKFVPHLAPASSWMACLMTAKNCALSARASLC
jgi:hypothetical protein